MKYLLFFAILISSNSFSQARDAKEQNKQTYFSYLSLCNIKMQFLGKNRVTVDQDNKQTKAVIKKSKINPGYFLAIANGKTIATFSFEETDILIVNQKYESPCEVSKIINLKKMRTVDTLVVEQFLNDFDYPDNEVESINNKAFYLQKYGDYPIAIFLLNKIIKKYPNRTVAYLNIADCYWGLNNKMIAIDNYKKYCELMKDQNKDLKKIPSYIYERIK